MVTNNYKFLNFNNEDSSTFRYRLLAFAISHRFAKASHFIHVADEIIRLDLVDEFKQFDPSEHPNLLKGSSKYTGKV